jgi:hypothetical protein
MPILKDLLIGAAVVFLLCYLCGNTAPRHGLTAAVIVSIILGLALKFL